MNEQQMIDIFIPTLYRPENVKRVLKSLWANTEMPYVAYVMCDENDHKTKEVAWLEGATVFTDTLDQRYTTRIQYMYEASLSPWVLLGSDDVVFQKGWDIEASKYFDSHSVIAFDDQCNPNLPGTNFLVKREYIQKYSGVVDAPNRVLHHGYYHNYCDNELWGTASARNQFIKCKGIIQHLHPMTYDTQWDETYQKAKDHWDEDAALFNSRKKMWTV